MTNSLSHKTIFQGTENKSNWFEALEDFQRREEAYASVLSHEGVDGSHLKISALKHKQNVEILDILAYLKEQGMTQWVGYVEGCVESDYLTQLRSLKEKIENTPDLPYPGTRAYRKFVAEGLAAGFNVEKQEAASEPSVAAAEPDVVTEEPVAAPAPAKALSSYMLQAIDGLEKRKAEYQKQKEWKDAGIMMTSERYDDKIKICGAVQTVLHELSDLGVEGWVGYAEGRDEQTYLSELKQLKKAIENGGVIPPAGTDEYMQFVGAAMGRKDIPAAKDYPADHSLDLLGDVGLDRTKDEPSITRFLDEDKANPLPKTDGVVLSWGAVSRTVCAKVKTFALSTRDNLRANFKEIALGAVTGCVAKAALIATFGVAAGGITLPVLAVAGAAGACSGTIRAAYRNQKRVNAFNSTAMLDAEASLPQWGPVYRESLGASALKGAVAGVVGGYLGAQFFDAVSHTSFGHWLRDLFVSTNATESTNGSSVRMAVTRPAVSGVNATVPASNGTVALGNNTVASVNATALNGTVGASPETVNASTVRPPVTQPAAAVNGTAASGNSTVFTAKAAPVNGTVEASNATVSNSTGALAPSVLPQTKLIGMDSLKDVLTQEQIAKLPKRILKLAASGKPEDMLRFYKEASNHYLNKVGGKSMRKVGAALIERGVQLAEQANITDGTAKKLFADYSYVKAWGRGLVADRAVAIDYAKRAGDAVNNFGGRLLKLFGAAAQATTVGDVVSPVAPQGISLPKIAAPRLTV